MQIIKQTPNLKVHYTSILSTLTALLLLQICLATTAYATPTFKLDGSGKYSLNSYIEYLDDPDGNFTINEVATGKASLFKLLDKSKPLGYDFKDKAIWLRIAVDFSQYKDPYWFLINDYEHIGNFKVFYPTATGFQQVEMDENLPQEGRQFNVREYIYKIPTPQISPSYFYVRIAPHTRYFRIELALADIAGVIESGQGSQLAYGLFFGGLLTLWLYNFALYINLRDKAYLYYIYYLGGFALVFFHIYGFAPYLFSLTPFWEQFFAASGFCSVQGMVMFARQLLLLKTTMKWVDRYLIVFQWVLPIGALVTFALPVGTPFKYLNILILLIIPVLVFAGIRRWIQGYLPAKIYSYGWIIFSTALGVLSLRSLGILPSNIITNNAVMVASVWEAIIFSLALAARLRLREKEEMDKSKQLMLQMEKAVEMEKMAVQQKTMFIAAVNHELRTPLQSLTGSIEVLSVMAKSSPMEKFVEKISRASEQIVAQMRDIGEYSRLEAEVLSVRKKSFVLHDLLSVVVDDFSKMATDRGICLALKNTDNDVSIVGDYDRIRQILNNLVSNAIKFTEQGTVTIEGKVELSSRPDDLSNSALLSIYVVDTGIGISEEDLPKIFDTFAQLESKNKTLGTGLGLAIVKRIIELLNATISVESQVGKGSKFKVCIPVHKR